MPTFDFVNKLDLQLIDDAINDTVRRIGQRYDLKDSKIELELNKKDKTIHLQAPDKMKFDAVRDLMMEIFSKKGLSPKTVDWGKKEDASLGAVRAQLKLVEGIDKESAKTINTLIKDSGIKVKSVTQGDQLRVEGKSIDDLQAVIKLVREADIAVPVQAVNMKR